MPFHSLARIISVQLGRRTYTLVLGESTHPLSFARVGWARLNFPSSPFILPHAFMTAASLASLLRSPLTRCAKIRVNFSLPLKSRAYLCMKGRKGRFRSGLAGE